MKNATPQADRANEAMKQMAATSIYSYAEIRKAVHEIAETPDAMALKIWAGTQLVQKLGK